MAMERDEVTDTINARLALIDRIGKTEKKLAEDRVTLGALDAQLRRLQMEHRMQLAGVPR